MFDTLKGIRRHCSPPVYNTVPSEYAIVMMTMALTTSSYTSMVLRGFQAIFAIVIIVISVNLINGHKEGALPVTLGFAAVVGAVSMFAASVNVAANFKEFLNEQISAVIDSAAALLNLAGGIVS